MKIYYTYFRLFPHIFYVYVARNNYKNMVETKEGWLIYFKHITSKELGKATDLGEAS